jgi:cell division protein FtsB
MRASYVDNLKASEQQLQGFAAEESALKAEIEKLKREAEERTKTLS